MRPLSIAIASVTALAMMTVCATPATAQGAFGLKGGLSSSTISVATEADSVFDPRQERGFVGGAALMLPGNRIGGLQVEVLVHQKGGQDVLRQGDRLELTYLEVPVVLHADLIQGRKSAVFVTFGPSFAINLKASYESDGMTEDVGDDVERFDLGLNIGAGVEVGPLVVEARYTWGLRNAFADGDVEARFKNRSLAVTVGFWSR